MESSRRSNSGRWARASRFIAVLALGWGTSGAHGTVENIVQGKQPKIVNSLDSIMSPHGTSRLFGNLNVKVTHTDAEGFPTTRTVRVPVDVSAKGSLDYQKASLSKLKLRGLIASRDAIKQQYNVFHPDKLSYGRKQHVDAIADVVQGKDRDDAYNKATLDRAVKLMQKEKLAAPKGGKKP